MIITVEVGGSSTQAIQFDHAGAGTIVPLTAHQHDPWLLASPGLVEGDRIRGAHQLGWMDVHASQVLHMASPPLVSMNDAEAAALGEWWLRGRPSGTLLYIGLGTGVGSAAVAHGTILPINFSHRTSFGAKRCPGCGQVGCLNGQIGGEALPTPLRATDIETVVALLVAAISQQERVLDQIVIGGGLTRHYPSIVAGVQTHVDLEVSCSACPAQYKSAAPFGLLYAWHTH